VPPDCAAPPGPGLGLGLGLGLELGLGLVPLCLISHGMWDRLRFRFGVVDVLFLTSPVFS
jgi:hypothetical protein